MLLQLMSLFFNVLLDLSFLVMSFFANVHRDLKNIQIHAGKKMEKSNVLMSFGWDAHKTIHPMV